MSRRSAAPRSASSPRAPAGGRRRCRRSRTRRHPCSSAPRRSARRSSARPCTSRRRSPSTSGPTAHGMRSGRRCASCCGSRSARPAPPRAWSPGLQVDAAAVARNLALHGGLIVAERLVDRARPAASARSASTRSSPRRRGEDRTSRQPPAAREPRASARVDVDARCSTRRTTPASPRGSSIERPSEERDRDRSPHRAHRAGRSRRRAARRARPVARHVDDPVGERVAAARRALPRRRVGPAGARRLAPRAEPFTVADLADAVAAAIGALGAERVLYAGVSLGGATGLELLLRHPDLVDAAAIVASGAQLGDPAGWHERAAQVRAQSTSSLIIAVGAALVRARLDRAGARAVGPPAARAAGRRRRELRAVLRSARRLRRARPARRDRACRCSRCGASTTPWRPRRSPSRSPTASRDGRAERSPAPRTCPRPSARRDGAPRSSTSSTADRQWKETHG